MEYASLADELNKWRMAEGMPMTLNLIGDWLYGISEVPDETIAALRKAAAQIRKRELDARNSASQDLDSKLAKLWGDNHG